MKESWWRRLGGEVVQAWAIVAKDIRVYYLQPPTIMYGVLMPFFIFFSFSVKRNLGTEINIANLLALTSFFTASSVGPIIIPLERRERTYDRLLTAPMSLAIVLAAKAFVGVVFALVTSTIPLAAGVIFGGIRPAFLPVIIGAVVLTTAAFAAFGLLFASLPAQSVGTIMMPSMLLRWPLLFISGVFIPLREMAPWARALSYLSPLTYGQDLLHHAMISQFYDQLIGPCGRIRGEADPYLVQQMGVHPLEMDIAALVILTMLFMAVAYYLHRVSRRLGQ